MSNRIYSFFVDELEITFYEDYVERKFSDIFSVYEFYAGHKNVTVKGNKLVMIDALGVKTHVKFKGQDIQYMDQICEQINSAIQKSKQNNDLARTKTKKEPEYRFPCGKYAISVYDNYAEIVDGKGRVSEFLLNDLISIFVSPAGVLSGDVSFRANSKKSINFSYRKADAQKIDCVIRYIIEQAIKIKTGKYGVSEPKEAPIYPKDEPKVKNEPQTKAPEKEQKPVEPTVSTTPNFQPSVRRASEGSNVKTADILKLKELYDLGAITEEEFTQKKRQLLGL